MFSAAIASTSTKELFISKLATWIDQTTTALPETDLFDCVTGGWPTDASEFIARPVVGGHFALLALES